MARRKVTYTLYLFAIGVMFARLNTAIL